MVFMNVEHWKGRRWYEDWCALTECPFDGAEPGEWKEMYDILSAVRAPFDEAQGPMLEERAQIATIVERMRSLVVGVSVDKVSSALCGSPGED